MSMSIEVQCDCPHGAGSRRSVTTLGSRPAQTADCSPWANALYPSRPDTVKARLDFIGASSFESVQFSSNFVAAQRGSGEVGTQLGLGQENVHLFLVFPPSRL
ncbi:hypothetical protein J3459_007583 [Metarhizium acridum]|nr:hypothetical protein J3459_007583 [Metarhizium acridum]